MLVPWEAPRMTCGPMCEGTRHTNPSNPVFLGGWGRAAPTPHPQHLTLASFFTVSALLSLLEVLAALGEFRPLERMSSLMGEARPSGLAGCFFRPLRSVDICPPKPEAGETGPQSRHGPPEPSTHTEASKADPTVALMANLSLAEQGQYGETGHNDSH